MKVWKNIQGEALGSVFAQLLTVMEQREELTCVIAKATADRLAGMSAKDKSETEKNAKQAKQTLQNPRGLTASLAQEEEDRTNALNKLLFKNQADLGAMAKVMVEALILTTQIDDIRRRKAQAEVEAKTPRMKAQERALLDALYNAGCTLWQLRQLSNDDLAYLAAFVAEKARDPRHRKGGGHAMAAFRAGHLELAVEGLTADEQEAVLIAAGRISEADLEAKKAFEAAAGRPLDLAPTLAGSLARAAEVRRAEDFWPGTERTIDHAERQAFERDLQTLVEAMADGKAVEERAWEILLPSTRTSDEDPREAAVPPALYEAVAREMLDHVHGPERDRWDALMAQVGQDFSTRRLFAERLAAEEAASPLVRHGSQAILLAADWRAALQRYQDEDVRDLAILVRDRPEVRWLAQCRGIDVPATLTIEPPFLQAARLLGQPPEEIIWELFDPPPGGRQTAASYEAAPHAGPSRAADLQDDDDDY